jgi:hypothetical protein
MTLPGFTAEMSLAPRLRSYGSPNTSNGEEMGVHLAQDSFRRAVFDPYFRPSRLQWPLVEPECICLRFGSDGRCLRRICF